MTGDSQAGTGRVTVPAQLGRTPDTPRHDCPAGEMLPVTLLPLLPLLVSLPVIAGQTEPRLRYFLCEQETEM